MIELLARNWGLVALRGAAAVLFGVLTLVNPMISLAVLVFFFGVYSLVDGGLTMIAAVANRREEAYWTSLLISGLLGVAVGVVTLLWPSVTAIALVYIIAAWAVIVGLGEIFSAIRLREEIEGEWVLALAGTVSLLFGIGLALFPGTGALALVLWIGVFAIVEGVLRIALGFRLRSWGRERGAIEG